MHFHWNYETWVVDQQGIQVLHKGHRPTSVHKCSNLNSQIQFKASMEFLKTCLKSQISNNISYLYMISIITAAISTANAYLGMRIKGSSYECRQYESVQNPRFYTPDFKVYAWELSKSSLIDQFRTFRTWGGIRKILWVLVHICNYAQR